MMNLPHLTFLRSFEAAARHLSFTAAAEELNCTQSAVSNHVRSLEEFLQRPLFVRHPRSLSLTDVGEAYLPSVRHALQKSTLPRNRSSCGRIPAKWWFLARSVWPRTGCRM